jgi:hypothetical protein
MMFYPDPASGCNFCSAQYGSTAGTYANALTFGAPNESAMFPALDTNPQKGEYRARMTAMGITLTPTVTAALLTGMRMVCGYIRPNPNSSTPNLYSWSNIEDTTGTNSTFVDALIDRQEIPFVPGKPVNFSYKFDGVPKFISPYDSAGLSNPISVVSKDDIQPIFVIAIFGGAPASSTITMNYQAVYHWEVIPVKPNAMTQRPQRSVYSPSALADGLNRNSQSGTMSALDPNVWGFRSH